jgi:arsenate reductase
MFPKEWKIYSAGTIAAGLFPQTVEAMREAGLDISGQYSKTVNDVPVSEIDLVITLCGDAQNNCPVFPQRVKKEHWPIKDPARDIDTPRELESFRNVRDDIKKRIQDLVKRLS